MKVKRVKVSAANQKNGKACARALAKLATARMIWTDEVIRSGRAYLG